MSTTTQTGYYTGVGKQRPLILPEGVTARFVLHLLPGDDGRVQTSCDPPSLIRRGTAHWEDYPGAPEGAVAAISAIRAVLLQNSGWARLVVQYTESAPATASPFLTNQAANQEPAAWNQPTS